MTVAELIEELKNYPEFNSFRNHLADKDIDTIKAKLNNN